MLKSITNMLICPVCSSQDEPELHIFNDGNDGHVKDGILTCHSCKNWFSIEDELLEYIHPSLSYIDHRSNFYHQFERQFQSLNISIENAPNDDKHLSGQLKQRAHFDAFAEDEQLSYDDFENLPFWIANDNAVNKRWEACQKNKPGWLLDVGCGNGRSALRFFGEEIKVVGIDISRKMVRKAIERSKKSALHVTRTFMVGDGAKLSFKNECFDYAVTSGVLSNLPDVISTCRDIQKVLKRGGIYFGLENNKSMFRAIFDALAGIFAPWKNEKGSTPEISHQMLKDWHKEFNVQVNSITSVFLPPVIFNIFGNKWAFILLKLSNSFFYLLGLKRHGGLIIFEIKKK